MRSRSRLLAPAFALTLLLGASACSDDTNDKVSDAADSVGSDVSDAAGDIREDAEDGAGAVGARTQAEALPARRKGNHTPHPAGLPTQAPHKHAPPPTPPGRGGAGGPPQPGRPPTSPATWR